MAAEFLDHKQQPNIIKLMALKEKIQLKSPLQQDGMLHHFRLQVYLALNVRFARFPHLWTGRN
jgi:hypothetical protein